MKRLIICFDGTWNRANSGTNIYHLSNLIVEGPVSQGGDTVEQLISYDAGVGTGVLDSVTGGGFGVGLSENVWDAYDWLVEKYDDDDEIYIFGFSRGAFTARSLVGLIAKCGLLYRGAPLPTEEMWSAYQILGRYGDPRTKSQPSENWWEKIVGRAAPPFRPIWRLQRAAWDDDDQAEPIALPQNAAEHLLVRWSRRVKIHCVGVFDTVGSLGLDALAIPGLRSHLAQFHDTHLSSLIVNGFHALAIDEHRANFAGILWRQALDTGLPVGTTRHGGQIEQCWFAGAHSNVGGGYEDDVLAQIPLQWMIRKTKSLGLVYKPEATAQPQGSVADDVVAVRATAAHPRRPGVARSRPLIRDSYAEFGGGIWKNIIRSKREYRRIGGPAEIENGIAMRPSNEVLDPSVPLLINVARGASHYNPPNLWEYLNRTSVPPSPRPKHVYLEGTKDKVMLLLWAVVAGWGVAVIAHAVHQPMGWWGAAGALLAVVFDWLESALNFRSALFPDGRPSPARGGSAGQFPSVAGTAVEAGLAVCITIRLAAIAAFGTGLIAAVVSAIRWAATAHPSPESLWLAGVGILCAAIWSAMRWCGYPMSQAGMGSIVALQSASTPQAVTAYFEQWSSSHDAGSRRFLRPIAESLYRDMLGFIPFYGAALVVGLTLAFSLAASFWLGTASGISARLMVWRDQPLCWIVPLAAMALCALADYVEDIAHLRYLRAYPNPPSAGLVRGARAATLLKFALFVPAAGIVGLLLPLALAGKEALRLLRGESSLVGVIDEIAVLTCLAVAVASLVQRRRASKSPGEASLQTPVAEPQLLETRKGPP